MAAALLLASCSSIGAELELEAELESRGFSDVTATSYEDDGDGHLDVSANVADEGEQAVTRRTAEVGRLAWTTFPYRFDRMQVSLEHGTATSRQVLRASDLQAQHGPRPAHLSDRSVSDEERRLAVWFAVGFWIAFLVFSGVVVLVAVLVVRSRRRRPPGPGAGGWQPPPGYPPGPPAEHYPSPYPTPQAPPYPPYPPYPSFPTGAPGPTPGPVPPGGWGPHAAPGRS